MSQTVLQCVYGTPHKIELFLLFRDQVHLGSDLKMTVGWLTVGLVKCCGTPPLCFRGLIGSSKCFSITILQITSFHISTLSAVPGRKPITHNTLHEKEGGSENDQLLSMQTKATAEFQ